MHIYISGGAKNGKSYYAQRQAQALAAGGGADGAQLVRPLYYVATMLPTDDEDLARIARHLKEREGWGFTTIEQSHHMEEVPAKADPDGVFLLDSDAPARVAEQLVRFLEDTKDAVLVSDYIYGGGARYDEWTQAYMEGLAYIDKTVAAVCDKVIEVAAGQIINYK